MSAPPYMQLYVADYLGDTRHLTTEQHGAYLLLLMAMWRAGGTLPAEPAKLARMAGLSPAKWAKISDDVLAFFDATDDGLVHGRVTKELKKYARTSEERREAGKRGGQAKALKTLKADVAKATDLPQQKATISEPEPKKVSVANATSLFETAWRAYPHVKGRSSKPKALLAWRKLSDPDREALPAACERYRRDGREPNADCGAPGMHRWLGEGRHADWLEQPAEDIAPTPEIEAHRLVRFRETGEWRSSWGPPPTFPAKPLNFLTTRDAAA